MGSREWGLRQRREKIGRGGQIRGRARAEREVIRGEAESAGRPEGFLEMAAGLLSIVVVLFSSVLGVSLSL